MTKFDLADLEKIHLAVDMAERFIRGESYHGDKPQVLLQEFDRLMEKVRDERHRATMQLEDDHRLASKTVEDADGGQFIHMSTK